MSGALVGLLVVLAVALLLTQWVRRAQLGERRRSTGAKPGRPSPVATVLLVLVVVGIVVLAVVRR